MNNTNQVDEIEINERLTAFKKAVISPTLTAISVSITGSNDPFGGIF